MNELSQSLIGNEPERDKNRKTAVFVSAAQYILRRLPAAILGMAIGAAYVKTDNNYLNERLENANPAGYSLSK